MQRPKWSRLRESTAASSEPQLQRGGSEPEPKLDADLDYDDDGETKDCSKCSSGLLDDGTTCPACKGAGTVPLRESQLSTADRRGLDKSQFAIPSKAPDSGSYPIPDLAHAKNALARSAGKPEANTVKAAVYKKFPTLKESGNPLEDRNAELEDLLATMTERLREANPDPLGSTFAPMNAADGGYEVVLIREGYGSGDPDAPTNRWYTKHAVQELVSSGCCEGMQAYADHPSLEEEEFLPERSIRDMVGSYTGVKLAESVAGLAEARAIFKPVKGPGYEWVDSLAEAAVANRTGKPLVGISLYGAAAGDDRERPDGTFGPMADLIRPASGDIVTNAGAGGEFVRRLMESARAKRANLNTLPKENHMQLSELITKIKESATKLREADTDKKHSALADELEKLSGEKVEAPTPDLSSLTVEKLQESAPTLVATLRESAKAEVKIPTTTPEADAALKQENEKLAGELRESKKAVADTNMALTGLKVMREAKVAEEDAEFFLAKFREAGARDETAMKAVIDAEKQREDRIVARVRESAGLDYGVEGVPGNTGGSTEGLLDLGESIPKPEKAAA